MTFKILFTGLLALLLLIPLSMVSSLIQEREQRRNAAVAEVSSKWGFRQEIAGPVLVVPFRSQYTDEKNVTRTRIENAYFLPESIRTGARIIPQARHRGLYEVILYSIKDFAFSGQFRSPDFEKLGIAEQNVLWERAYLAVGIPDTRGIGRGVTLRWNGREVPFLPGVKDAAIFGTGIHAPLGEAVRREAGSRYDFGLDLRGSSALSFVPLGKETVVELSSPWAHPSFEGAYLPDSHRVTSAGFSARWKVSYFGRNFSQEWIQSQMPGRDILARSAFGVRMYQPVDFYQKCVRAVKYGFLFIFLTFLSFFMFELFNRLNIHPLQYLMVGFAMCIFYLLFIALSEHIGFSASYAVSSLSVMALITGYCVKVLQTRGRAGVMFGLLFGLYSYLFILLENEDYALLLGSLALFAILALVMYLTRNVDWYAIRMGGQNGEGAVETA
ncbi:MAG: cell envelope integrity protein CreD [Spirochaetes bacterium]|nr:cell envelope integrity protein CreD [Spirochaetota bacterium]